MGEVLSFRSPTPVIYFSSAGRAADGDEVFAVEVRPCPEGMNPRFETASHDDAMCYAWDLRRTHLWKIDRSGIEVARIIHGSLDREPFKPICGPNPFGGDAA